LLWMKSGFFLIEYSQTQDESCIATSDYNLSGSFLHHSTCTKFQNWASFHCLHVYTGPAQL
jgi:hypothetical protein